MKEAVYVDVGKPLKFERFEMYHAPMGWTR